MTPNASCSSQAPTERRNLSQYYYILREFDRDTSGGNPELPAFSNNEAIFQTVIQPITTFEPFGHDRSKMMFWRCEFGEDGFPTTMKCKIMAV
jgi:hypothetical protein